MKKDFFSIPNTAAHDIHFWCDNLLFRLFSIHYYCFYINRHVHAHVFSSNSTFFYDMLPFIRKGIHTTELLHNFTFGKNGMEFFGLANYKFLHTRIAGDAHTLSNIRAQYLQYNIGAAYLDKVILIEPGVDIPPPPEKSFSLPLKILYAGRGGLQKRIFLINQILERCVAGNMAVEFHFAGTMISELSDFAKAHAIIHGAVTSRAEMYKIYTGSHVVLLTSAYEGFPMVIKEGMACGCVPVVTALPGNMTHLKQRENALLIDAVENEEEVVALGIKCIRELAGDMNLLQRLSGRAYEYARLNFTASTVMNRYRTFLLS